MNGEITVFICDDVAQLRLLLRYGLEEDPGIRVVGEAGDGRSGVEGIAATQPDVVLLDLAMPGLDGLEALPLIHQRAPNSNVIIFSGFEARRMSEAALSRHASGYIEKGEPVETVRAVVREVVTHRENVGAMKQLYQAARRGDMGAILEHVDPDVEIGPIPDIAEEPHRGHDGIRRFFEEARTFDELSINVQQFRARGEHVLLLGRYRSRRGGTLIDSPIAFLARLRDGKLAEAQSFASWDRAMQALAEQPE